MEEGRASRQGRFDEAGGNYWGEGEGEGESGSEGEGGG